MMSKEIETIAIDPFLQEACKLVAAYLMGPNKTAPEQIAPLVLTVYDDLKKLQKGGVGGAIKPAVPISKSITPDFIICLEDGKELKMMKRYLRTHYNMSPEEYRRKWRLPADYPMTAPSYAKERSQLAKDIGLGKK